MQKERFARRTAWNLVTNRYSDALEEHRRAGRELLDLTASNPTTIGLAYREQELLCAFTCREALVYEPAAKGLRGAREAIAGYYAEKGSRVAAGDLILTTSTSEAYSFVFRLLCDAGDTVLVPTPSYPLFEFLADLQDVKLVPYELVYDREWQIDFPSMRRAMVQAAEAGSRCRAVLVVHPNNPTGSYVKPHELDELNRLCSEHELAIVADEVFLDYVLDAPDSVAFAHLGRPLPHKDKIASRAPIDLSRSLPPATDVLTFSANGAVLTFTLSGLSKISGLPQMKVAWIATSGPDPWKREALARLEVIADTYLSMNAPVQWAIPVMLEERHTIQQQLRERVAANKSLLDYLLAQQNLCNALHVEGGWYAVLRVPVFGSDEDLAIGLLRATSVLIQPGHFYDFPGDGYLVLSLITPTAVFSEGVRRLLRYIEEHS